MAHADFLSHNVPVNTEIKETPDSYSNLYSKAVNLSELEKGWLSVERQRDSEILDSITKFQSLTLPSEISHTYDTRQGIL